jgi:TetR/AcrR family transcriptional regulator, mexJK operon transcriptional repressor
MASSADPDAAPATDSAATARLPPRSARKHDAILAAARPVFLRKGYVGTSMDEVAALAGVSKQTVYKHFADKERLFVELITSTVDAISDPVHAEVLALADSGDVQADLLDLARRLLARVIQPELLELRRLIIGEAGRFPQLGRAFYDSGVGRTVTALADALTRLNDRGLLEVDDPARAAAQFNWLTMSAPINQVMLLGPDALPTSAELDGYASGAVTAFLRAYAP